MYFAQLKDGRAVVVTNGGMAPLRELDFHGDLMALIREGSDSIDQILQRLEWYAGEPVPGIEQFDAPLRQPGKIIAIGLNYQDHALESKMEVPASPLVFTKFSSSITGPGDDICIPEQLTREVDYEVELGVVIGKTAKNVSEEMALEYVFGYTVLNDVSARDLQFVDKQWVRGKSLDTFCPMGPGIVPASEIADPQNLRVECEVNGTVLQDANTRDMIFSVATLVSRLSHSFTLHAGDIIATGTPSGVGFSRKPPIYLKPGDRMITRISAVGEIRNNIVAV